MTSPFPAQVRTARTELTALLAGTDPDAACRVRELAQVSNPVPTVAVLGETNRGKSSLVNALLACPGLSPVDAAVATGTYLVVSHAQAWTAQARYADERAPVPVETTELAQWVGVNARLPEGIAPPRFVHARGPVPLLETLTLIDTPGVGGLQGVHGELAVDAAADATALLMVVDASSPFTSGELEFLQKVAQRVETVVFALTKTDVHRGWREVLDADVALLSTHAPGSPARRSIPSRRGCRRWRPRRPTRK